MPLLPLSQMMDISGKPHPVLVITAQDRTVGLMVDEIIDILEEKLEVQLQSQDGDTVGSAELRGEAVELIDVTYYMQLAFSHLTQQEPLAILYVENDPFFRDTLKPVLTGAGYRVTSTLSADEAQALLDSGTEYAAVLIDSEMAGSDGVPLAATMRGPLLADNVPLLVLHEVPTPSVLSMASDHTMTAHVSKLDRQYLLNTLSSLLALNERNEGAGYFAREMAA
jgi:two-component system chemotaxis sensor kinase CheA